MCGRYTIFTEEEIIEMQEIINQINKKYGYDTVKTGEIFPSDVAPIVRMADGKAEIDRGTWGFPGFGTVKRPIINARSETAHEKRMFSEPLKKSRCVVPSTGFYEWTHENKKAVDKYLFRQPDTSMLYLAGMTWSFMDTSGEWRDHYVILTQASNEYIAPYHDRMPVILQKNELVKWMRDDEYVSTVFTRTGPELLSEKAG